MEFDPVIRFLNEKEKFILTAHETPDGDALGAEYALFRALQQMGKKVLIFNADPAPKKYTFFEPEEVFVVLKGEDQLPADITDYVLIILDVNDINNIGQIKNLLLPKVQEYFIIDHHDSEADTLAKNFIAKSASSTCELLCSLFKALPITIDGPMARALYMGIVFDTGSFIYPKTTALTFKIAEELVSLGANPNEIYVNVFQSNSTSSLVLMSRVLATLKLELDEHIAIQTMTREVIIESGGKYAESDQIINIPLRSQEVQVSIFFKENLQGLKRCSLRSKGNIDVAMIAQTYGGGGHKTAAGFKCPRPFAAIQEELLEALRKYF